jgi:hypothetical protein
MTVGRHPCRHSGADERSLITYIATAKQSQLTRAKSTQVASRIMCEWCAHRSLNEKSAPVAPNLRCGRSMSIFNLKHRTKGGCPLLEGIVAGRLSNGAVHLACLVAVQPATGGCGSQRKRERDGPSEIIQENLRISPSLYRKMMS